MKLQCTRNGLYTGYFIAWLQHPQYQPLHRQLRLLHRPVSASSSPAVCTLMSEHGNSGLVGMKHNALWTDQGRLQA